MEAVQPKKKGRETLRDSRPRVSGKDSARVSHNLSHFSACVAQSEPSALPQHTPCVGLPRPTRVPPPALSSVESSTAASPQASLQPLWQSFLLPSALPGARVSHQPRAPPPSLSPLNACTPGEPSAPVCRRPFEQHSAWAPPRTTPHPSTQAFKERASLNTASNFTPIRCTGDPPMVRA